MKKILTYIFVCLAVHAYGQNVLSTNYLQLTRTGSLTTTGTNQLYIALSASNDTLTGDLSISYGSTPLIGTQYTIWFDGTTILPNGHNIYIQGSTVTSIVSGYANQIFTCTYDGKSWSVVNTTQIVYSLLTGTYATLASPTFTGTVTIPLVSGNADSSAKAAATGYVKQVVNLYAPLASPVLTGNPIAPTQSLNTNNATIATTAYSDRGTSAATAVGNAAQLTANTADSLASRSVSQLINLTQVVQVDTWAAATQTVIPTANFYFLNVQKVTGNVTVNITPLSNSIPASEIIIFLGFTGSYTVTAGSNCVFSTITGSASVEQTLVLHWNGFVYYK